MTTITRGSAVARLRVGNSGLATAAVSGLVVPDAALALSTMSADAAASAGAKAVVYRLERAVTAYCLDHMPRHDKFSAAGQALPAALVVTAGDFPMFEAYCRRAGQGGMIRRAFTDAERALAWVEAQAAMLRVTMAMRTCRARPTWPCTPPETSRDLR